MTSRRKPENSASRFWRADDSEVRVGRRNDTGGSGDSGAVEMAAAEVAAMEVAAALFVSQDVDLEKEEVEVVKEVAEKEVATDS